MHTRWLIPLLAAAVGAGASAQTAQAPAVPSKPAAAAEKPRAAVPELPPDAKAYSEATRIADPEKKIAALEKWKTDFPDSSMRFSADDSILSTLIQRFPGQTDRIRKQAKSVYAAAPRARKGQVANTVAGDLLDGNVLLPLARRYATRGVNAMKEAVYLQEQKDGYRKRKQTLPSDDELVKQYRESRATRVATLGRIEVKLGRTDEGRKLLEESYAANSSQPTVAAALGELAAKAGDDAKAFDYLVTARLSGKAPDSAVAALDALYRKAHAGSLDGMDAMLDAEYRKRFPNPLRLDPYQPSPKRSDRVVLAEVFTGAGCPPCVGADLAFDAAAERYTRRDLAVLMYHQHIPRPDPMTTPETTARFQYYGGGGVPTFVIDGDDKKSGGSERDRTRTVYDRFNPDIEKELEAPAEAHLSVGASVSGSKVSVRTIVRGVRSDSKDLKLRVVLAEKELRYSGENGIRFHTMVVRALGGPNGEGFPLQGGADATFEQAFDLDEISQAIKAHLDDYEAKGHRGESFRFREKKYEIAHTDLAVVVFVQDDKTKHVLQAGFVDLSVPAGHRITEDSVR